MTVDLKSAGMRMNRQKLQEVFEQKIKPELGRIRNQDKYLKIMLQLAENSSANKGKGIRESQLIEEVKPANNSLNRLADAGFVEITMPVGDGTLLVDSINNKIELFKKREMIEKYYANFQIHLKKDAEANEIAKEVLSINDDWKMEKWLSSLEEQEDFSEYNLVVFKLLEKGIDIKKYNYGPLNWRKMAKYYNISEKTKDLLEG